MDGCTLLLSRKWLPVSSNSNNNGNGKRHRAEKYRAGSSISDDRHFITIPIALSLARHLLRALRLESRPHLRVNIISGGGVSGYWINRVTFWGRSDINLFLKYLIRYHQHSASSNEWRIQSGRRKLSSRNTSILQQKSLCHSELSNILISKERERERELKLYSGTLSFSIKRIKRANGRNTCAPLSFGERNMKERIYETTDSADNSHPWDLCWRNFTIVNWKKSIKM